MRVKRQRILLLHSVRPLAAVIGISHWRAPLASAIRILGGKYRRTTISQRSGSTPVRRSDRQRSNVNPSDCMHVVLGIGFSLAQWQSIEAQMTMLPAAWAKRRLTFGQHLLYANGLRLSEVRRARPQGQHALDAAFARKPCDHRWHAHRDRAAEPRACVAGNHDRLSRYRNSPRRRPDPKPDRLLAAQGCGRSRIAHALDDSPAVTARSRSYPTIRR